jgi:hypothetical protein
VLGGVALAIFGAPAVPVHAAVRYAVDKTGTSVAASQAEPNFSADYVFVTSCSSGKCVATATDGPIPKNPTPPQPSRYTWDGTRWVEHFDFQWIATWEKGLRKCGHLRGRGRSIRLGRTGRCAVAGTSTF